MLELLAEIMTVENIVAEDQCAGIATNELLANDERLRQSVRRWLHRVLDVHAPPAAITEHRFKTRRILRCRYDQHVANPRDHQRGERVVDHRFVVHGQQLLRDNMSDRVEPRTRTASE